MTTMTAHPSWCSRDHGDDTTVSELGPATARHLARALTITGQCGQFGEALRHAADVLGATS